MEKINAKEIITKSVLPVKPCEMQCSVMCVSNSHNTLKSTIRSKQNNITVKTEDQNKELENNVPPIYPNKEKIKDMKANIRQKLQRLEVQMSKIILNSYLTIIHTFEIYFQPWKRKPFQVSLPKRQLTIAHLPKLKTAERADSWKLYEKRRLEREKRD